VSSRCFRGDIVSSPIFPKDNGTSIMLLFPHRFDKCPPSVVREDFNHPFLLIVSSFFLIPSDVSIKLCISR